MNSKTAFGAVVMAVVACGLLYLVSGWGGAKKVVPPAVPGWVTRFDPARVTRLSVDWGDSQAVLAPTPMTDVWLLTAGGDTWPVAAARVRGALRLIAEIAIVEGEGDAEGLEKGVTVRLTLGREEGVLRVGSEVVGGKGWARFEGEGGPARIAVVEAGFARLWAKAGVMSWREATPLLPLPGETIRLAVSAGAMRSEVTRVRGQWGLTAPVGAPADAAFVNAALSRVHGMQVLRVLGAEEASAVGFETPAATVESETRVAGDGGGSVVQVAEIGVAADVSGESAYVRASARWVDEQGKARPGWGPTVFVVAKESIEKLTADARAYLSKRAVEAPGADVLRVDVKPVDGASKQYVRGVGGFGPEGGPISALVSLACEKDATIPVLESPSGWRAIVDVRLAGSSGAIAMIEVGEGEGPGGVKVLLVRTGEVWREYPWEGAVAVWLESLK